MRLQKLSVLSFKVLTKLWNKFAAAKVVCIRRVPHLLLLWPNFSEWNSLVNSFSTFFQHLQTYTDISRMHKWFVQIFSRYLPKLSAPVGFVHIWCFSWHNQEQSVTSQTKMKRFIFLGKPGITFVMAILLQGDGAEDWPYLGKAGLDMGEDTILIF